VGRQIINTEGAARTIANRRRLILLVVLAALVAIAVAVYVVRSHGAAGPPAATGAGSAGRAPAPART
jgi:hypothetical protein